ncbi:NADP-dependent oxidoreductase domain-containing protein 1 [Lepisosteus oculatus]|uniref:NADP-dependent oxidoreductase domain-containing protein 1 n=1 Tax=Lepisosteus oculatus TaxID=7918 RepID=UPI003720F73C
MTDVTQNLHSLDFECGLSENEKQLLFLRARSNGLTLSACAHAAFFCKLLSSSRRRLLKENVTLRSKTSDLKVLSEDQILKVGILGGGHIGKQLALVLMENTGLKPSNINISSRRPETLDDFQKMGIGCFYDNQRLAAWSDVLFLCCLPTHLSQVCADIHSKLRQDCIVYSLVTAVPLNRLKQLLSHSSVLKPEYGFVGSDSVSIWATTGHVTAALKDPKVISAACPLGMSGGLSIDIRWVVAVLYSLLNMCTTMNVDYKQTINMMNELFLLKDTSAQQNKMENAMQFTVENFVNASFASTLSSDEPLPWISLTDTQLKETPLSKILAENLVLRERLSATFCSVLGV